MRKVEVEMGPESMQKCDVKDKAQKKIKIKKKKDKAIASNFII